MTSAADLFALQEIDLRRDARRAFIADIESRLGESEEVLEAREAIEDSEAALQRLQRRQRESEAEVEDLDAKIQPLEARLYDGSVRNPKELTDMQKELALLKQRRAQLDDQALKLIESVEAAGRQLDQSRQELNRLESEWKAGQEHLLADKEKAETEYSQLNDQRAHYAEGMDRSALGLYENLRLNKQGRGVARVERGICQGCRVTLPTHLNQRLRTGTVLVQCPRCERILVAG
jgi:predicted  nucleic acid-binding Zn-ribbon protein